MNIRTLDGIVHVWTGTPAFACPVAWQTVPEADRVWGEISVFMVNTPVTCLECLALDPNTLQSVLT